MNIFVLDQSPEVAASYHCDQHLHKMILESAQMLSTAMHTWYPHLSKYLYKQAHPNHPCTLWISANKQNALWVVKLMLELDDIRLSLGCDSHSSMFVAKMLLDNIDVPLAGTDPFIFAGPLQYKLRPDLNIYQKYQEYYKLKQKLWLGTSRPMTYKNRPVPFFLQDSIK